MYAYGIVPYVVLSGSMEPRIETGSLSFININTPYEKILNFDIIAYRLGNNTLVTHRVVNKTNEGLETQGDNNKTKDGIVTTKENYVGKNIFWIPKVGFALRALQTARGKIILITIIAFLIVSGIMLGEEKEEQKI